MTMYCYYFKYFALQGNLFSVIVMHIMNTYKNDIEYIHTKEYSYQYTSK